MASHKSALKRHRQETARRERNRSHRARVRTALKKCRAAIEAGEVEQARSLLPGTLSLLDHTAKVGAIHANAAARAKSRLARAVNALGS